jgi:exopolyphosphatase/guanosine-5'-triphosphate,3'-diphosphate pyrophosphatase
MSRLGRHRSLQNRFLVRSSVTSSSRSRATIALQLSSRGLLSQVFHFTVSSRESQLVAVLDMGASAIRLVVAEIGPAFSIRVIEEASRAVLLGRDTFASGAIRAQTAEAAIAAVDGFRHIIDGYAATTRAVATSAVREARNRDAFLDRVRRRTGIEFDIINEAEESRLSFLAVRHSISEQSFAGEWALLIEVGGGSTSATLLNRGQPNRSGVYALGAIRLRQQLQLWKHPYDLQLVLLKRQIANVIDEIRLEFPLLDITDVIAMGGDVRFVASQIDEDEAGAIARDAFLAYCDHIEQFEDDQLVDMFGLQAGEAETLVPALLVYRALLAETSARRIVVSEASLRTGMLLDLAAGGRLGAADFEAQVLASAEAVGQKYRFDAPHGRHVSYLAACLFDALAAEHGLSDRERLLLQVAALLHDVGIYVSLRAHHKHSHYILAASQIFGLSDEEMAVVANVARYHRRALPQRSHLPYVALDRQDRLVVDKLAGILRIANALDAEHLQKVRDVRLAVRAGTWVIEYEASSDATMEQMAASARADMLAETFGRPVIVRSSGVSS